MYLGHFSLREAPFSITPDSAFFYPHEGAQAALNTLLVALRSGEGFLKIVGEVGCGKTVLCRQLLKTLQGEAVTAYIPNPDMGPDDLLMALCLELNVKPAPPISRHSVLNALRDCLLQHALDGRNVVVCIDEAQAIPLRTVESLRLLSNLETEKRKLLQVVMFGQPELDQKLANPAVRQLRQRIVFHYRMPGLKQQEAAHYLAHRLRVAGHRDGDVFPAAIARLLFRWSSGTPRLVNILAHKAMLLAYGEGKPRVTRSHVVMAAGDTEGLSAPGWWQRW